MEWDYTIQIPPEARIPPGHDDDRRTYSEELDSDAEDYNTRRSLLAAHDRLNAFYQQLAKGHRCQNPRLRRTGACRTSWTDTLTGQGQRRFMRRVHGRTQRLAR